MEKKFKYKLSEDIKKGDVDVSKGIRTKVSDVDPEHVSVTWDVSYGADKGMVVGKLTEALDLLRKIQGNNPDDRYFVKAFNDIKSIRNEYRGHIRNNYPIEYENIKNKKAYMKEDEDIEEISTSGGVGAYNTPYAFKKNTKNNSATDYYIKKFKYRLVPKKIKGSGLEVKQLWKENEI